MPITFSTHGWGADENDGTHHSIARILLERDDFNFIFLGKSSIGLEVSHPKVISTDWSAGGSTPNYLTARNRVTSVGAFLAAFIDWLHENDLVEFNQISIVGFSLGGWLILFRF